MPSLYRNRVKDYFQIIHNCAFIETLPILVGTFENISKENKLEIDLNIIPPLFTHLPWKKIRTNIFFEMDQVE